MIWILVANDGGARLFETPGGQGAIRPIHRWDYPEGKLKDQAFDADRPGRSFDRSGAQRHAMGPEVSPHRRKEAVFAGELADYLEKSLTQKRFKELILVAAPHLLGTLRQGLTPPLRETLRTELAKDLPDYLSERELFDHFYKDFGLGTPPPV